ELLALGVFAGDFPGQAILAAAVVAAKLFVGVQADHQQPLDFIGFKGLAPFELAANPNPAPTQLLWVQPLAGIAESIVTDPMTVAHPPLPLRELGFLLQLQKAGDTNHFAQDQAQPHGAGGNVGLRPGVGETTGQQRQVEAPLRIGNKLAQLGKVGIIHPVSFSCLRNSSALIWESSSSRSWSWWKCSIP